jgi:hypothetical protein
VPRGEFDTFSRSNFLSIKLKYSRSEAAALAMKTTARTAQIAGIMIIKKLSKEGLERVCWRLTGAQTALLAPLLQ